MTLFEPYSVRQMILRNRLVMPSMCMFTAHDGLANDFHLIHYATRAMGGVGLIIVETTGVLPNGRISARCLGLWEDEQIEPLRRVVEACHRSGANVAVQLSHAGRKCVVADVSRVVAPSCIRFSEMPDYQTPDELSRHEIEEIVEAFGMAAARAAAAGVDAVEVQAADGYLIHQFLSPLANERHDDYGGDASNRCRFLGAVIQSIRRKWSMPKPLFLRVPATDYSEGGIEILDIAKMVDMVRERVDVLHVGSGGLVPVMVPHTPGFQVSFAGALRNACALPVIAGGKITSAEQAENILQSHKADLVAMGRELLRNPYLPAISAQRLGCPALFSPQYERAFT